ncbi:MAG: HIT family protein [archaeon]
MTDCIFCKIVSGEIPSKKIYDDPRFMAFLDVNPRAKGHALVIPKKHAATLSDLSKEDAGSIFQIVQYIAKTITERLAAKGYNIGSNNSEPAGQAVPHFHIHIIPRYDTDKHKSGFEAAFQVQEPLKNDLDKTMSLLTRGSLLPAITTSQPQKEAKVAPKKEKGSEEEHEWKFKDAEDIMDDNIEN